MHIAFSNSTILKSREKQQEQSLYKPFAWELIKPQITERLQTPGLPVQLKTRGKALLGIEDEPQQPNHP